VLRAQTQAFLTLLPLPNPSILPAKERLSVMLVHQRNSDVFQSIDMEALRKEVSHVIRKYIKVAEDKNASKMTIKHEGEFDFLEMSFVLDQNNLLTHSAKRV
jgi:cell division topological specificity factor MinE